LPSSKYTESERKKNRLWIASKKSPHFSCQRLSLLTSLCRYSWQLLFEFAHQFQETNDSLGPEFYLYDLPYYKEDKIQLPTHFNIEPKITKKVKLDSLRQLHPNKFKLSHLIPGKTYFYHQRKDSLISFHIHEIQLGSFLRNTRYNAVEGYAFGLNPIQYKKNFTTSKSFIAFLGPYYAITKNKINGDVGLGFNNSIMELTLNAGNKVVQLNEANSSLSKFSLRSFCQYTRGKTLSKNIPKPKSSNTG
jgi:hypothetical protein